MTSIRSARQHEGVDLIPQYLLSLHTSRSQPPRQRTDEEMRRSMSDIHSLNDALKAAGAWVYGGQLDAASAAKVVRPRNSKIRVTDGPFLEAKEQIAGFYIIEAADLDGALDRAAQTSDEAA